MQNKKEKRVITQTSLTHYSYLNHNLTDVYDTEDLLNSLNYQYIKQKTH